MIIDFRNIGGGGGSGYTLPVATSSVLGGVKVGSGLTIKSDGTLNSQQDYKIVSGITDFTAGKLYGVVSQGNYEEYLEGSHLLCGNLHTDFSGTVQDSSINSSFNPWVQKYQMYIDSYIDRNASTGENTLTVKYGESTVLTETLSEGDNVFSLPTYDGLTGLTYSVNVTDGVQYYVVISGSVLNEQGYYIHQNVWTYNSNISNPVAVTYGYNDVCEIAYTDGTTSHTISTVATTATTGLVRIGEGINVDSAGTISVESQGGGIEVVTELPVSGTDGQMVMLNEFVPYKKLEISSVEYLTSVIAIGIPEKTFLYSYEWFGLYWDAYINSDNSFELYNRRDETSAVFSAGTVDGTYSLVTGDEVVNFTINVSNTGFTIADDRNIAKQNVVNGYDVEAHTKNDLYIWSDSGMTSLDIELSHNEKVAEFYFDEIPSFTGSAFTLCYSVNEWGNIDRYFKYTSGGTFVWGPWDNEWITLLEDGKWHWAFDGRIDRYIISDGYIMFNTTSENCKIEKSSLWNGKITKTGWVKYGYKGIVEKTSCYNDFKFNAGQEGWKYYNDNIFIWGVPAPSRGKYLYSPSDEYMQWAELPEVKNVVNELPKFGKEGELLVVPSADIVGTAATTAFIAKNSTNISDKNNFTFTDETGHMGDGQYIYVNKGNYTSTGDTLVAVIQMRTNENGDWNTSDLKEIYVYLKYDSGNNAYYYEAEWNFSYNNVTYNSAITISDGQSVDSDYFPIWWPNGGYGYKFNFVNSGDNLTFASRLSYYDIETQYPGYVEGEQYGEIAFRTPYYVKEFFNIGTSNTISTLYTFRGGQWINLGETQVPV